MKYRSVKKKKEFQKILSAGKRAYGAALTVVYLPAEETAMAVCVGKKYGKSVQRNRLKRLLREAFRSRADSLTRPCAFLLIPRVAAEYSYEAFRKDLGSVFRREGLQDA